MPKKPTYEELEQKVKELEKELIEHKRLNEALRESKQRFQEFIENISDWIWEVDREGVYTYSNRKVIELLGYEPEEVIGKTPFDFMLSEEAKRVSDIFSNFISSKKPFYSLENTTLHKDGYPVVMETSGIPFFNAEGKFLGYRGIDRDITDRKKAQEESEKRARLQAVLHTAGAVCHELNQPLQTILSLVEAARDDLEPEPAATLQQDLKDIKASVDKMAEITRKLNNITSYQTQDYVEDTQILDLDKSSGA